MIEMADRVGLRRRFRPQSDGLTLAKVQAHRTHRSRALAPRLREVVNTKSARSSLAPSRSSRRPRLLACMASSSSEMLLIGPAKPPHQQLVHAQPAGARERAGALHAADLAR